ncbi:MAG: hypothetical protein JNK35_11215, partial [Phycisphaerae bacterium]|nr:hypothetical protein [Phycisphaerae bacterium]
MTHVDLLVAAVAALPAGRALLAASEAGAWWSQQAAALIGAVGGSAGGLLGACLGVSLSVLAPRGVGRGPVLTACAAIALAGWALLVGAGLAGLVGQPFHVLLPLVIGGSVLGPLATLLLPVAINAYEIAAARRAIEDQGGPALSIAAGEVHPAVAGVLLRAWGPGGRLRRWAELVLWPSLVLTIGA